MKKLRNYKLMVQFYYQLFRVKSANEKDRPRYSTNLGCFSAYFDHMTVWQLVEASLSSSVTSMRGGSISAGVFGYRRYFSKLKPSVKASWIIGSNSEITSRWCNFVNSLETIFHAANESDCSWYSTDHDCFSAYSRQKKYLHTRIILNK